MDYYPRPSPPSSRRPPDRQPPSGPQLASIARRLILASPSQHYSDLIDAIKVEVLRQEFDYPHPDALTACLRGLEASWRRQGATIPVLGLTGPPRRPRPLTQDDPPWSQRRPPSAPWTSLRDVAPGLAPNGAVSRKRFAMLGSGRRSA